jgi:hypothetical protein
MSPQSETKLLELLSRIAVALEKVADGKSGSGQAGQSAPITAEVPFGKNKGKKLCDLGDKQVGFYAFTWTPSTSEAYPKPSQRDQAFKKAAESEAKQRGLVPDDQSGAESAPNPVVRPASSPQTPPPSSNDDEDLPF